MDVVTLEIRLSRARMPRVSFRPRDPRLLIAALVCGGLGLACLAMLT